MAKPPKNSLVDVTYDNPESRTSHTVEFHQSVFNVGGLGKLTDGKPDHETDIEWVWNQIEFLIHLTH